MSSPQRQSQYRAAVPAPDDSDFLDSDDGHDREHELTEMEAELAAVATPATSQATAATAGMRRRLRLQPVMPIMQMTHNFSFAVFGEELPSADELNRNQGREAAGLPVSTGRHSRHGSSQSGRLALSSQASLPGHSEPHGDGQQGSTIAPHLATDASIHWFSVDTELVYLSFFDDWGPLNVAMFYRFCLHLHHLINSAQEESEDSPTGASSTSNLHLILYTSSDARLKANAALLAAMYTMVCGDATPADAFWPLSNLELLPFRDAGYGRADYYLTIQDILYGVHRAISEQLLDLMTFDLEEYETYEQVQNGDWNWITPNIIAFASPNDKEYVNELRDRSQYQGRATPGLRRPLNPTFLRTIRYFKERNIKLVVRLNNPLYDSRVFEREGIEHIDLYFDDGSNPSEDIVRTFIAKADKVISDGGAIAVHCKAGLGRTGVLIGAYLAYKHGFAAGEAIGFMRIMRPGCVVGPQQHFMYKEMPNWIRWREQDDAAARLEQALAKQKQDLVGKRRLSSNDSSSVDTEVEVDISLGDDGTRLFKKLRKSSQGPVTPKKDEDESNDAYVPMAKPTPCVGQPRKSPSPSRKRMAQSSHPPATVGRVGSGSFTMGRSRIVSSSSSRSGETSTTTRQTSSHVRVPQDQAEIAQAGASDRHDGRDNDVSVPSQGSRVLTDSPRVHNVALSDVQAFTATVDGALENAAIPSAMQSDMYKMTKEPQQARTIETIAANDELFVQGWQSPEPPSSYIRQMSAKSHPSSPHAHHSGTPNSPSTPSRSVVRASPHIREKFGLRDSGSNQTTPRSRKEANGGSNLSQEHEPLSSLPATGVSLSSGSLTDRDASGSDEDGYTLQPGPIEGVQESDHRSQGSASAMVGQSSPVKSRAPSKQFSRVPSAQRGGTAPSGARPDPHLNGARPRMASNSQKSQAAAERPASRANHQIARPPSAAAGSTGRVAAARERLAQRQNAATTAADAAGRTNLKRSRVQSSDVANDNVRSNTGPSAKRVASGNRSTVAISSQNSTLPNPTRAALAPASSVATNAPSRPGSSVGHNAHVPRFAMSTAASAAKSVGTAARQAGFNKTTEGQSTAGTAASTSAQSRGHAASAHLSARGREGAQHNLPPVSARLNTRNLHRRRSSMGETDIIM